MRARIVKGAGDMYVGEVYATWTSYLLGREWTGWRDVTGPNLTWIGARLSLLAWKREHLPREFEI